MRYEVVVVTNYFEAYNPTHLSVTISLKEGWNMISLPFDDHNLSELVSLTAGELWIWTGTNYEPVDDVNKQQGFWVYCHSVDEVTLTSALSGTGMVTLFSGWNLVGPLQTCPAPGNAVIYHWDEFYEYLDENGTLEAGKGYWFFSEIDTEAVLK